MHDGPAYMFIIGDYSGKRRDAMHKKHKKTDFISLSIPT